MPDPKTRPTNNGYDPGRFTPKKLTPGRKLWYKQSGESIQAYEAFMTYLMLPQGERSHRKTADNLGKSISLMEKWSCQWSWALRVAGYEEHYLLIRLESVEAERDAMWLEQKRMADIGMNIVGAHFDELVQAIDEHGHSDRLKGDTLVRFFDTVTKVQRMAILGRIAGAAEVQERNEALAEQYSEELVQLIREVTNEIGLDPEQAEAMNEVLKRHLVGDAA